jgi:hypothetical protein
MVSSAMRFARELGLTDPVVGYQGGLIRAMPPEGSTRLGKLLVHTPLPASAAREIVAWTVAHGLDPHLNHLERFILRADDPRADDYSAFMGARAELVADLADSISHPVTKVLAVGEPPLPTDMATLAAAHFAGIADVTISHPRFLEFAGCEGPGDPVLARRLASRRPDARHRRPVRTTPGPAGPWRCVPLRRAGQAVARHISPPSRPGVAGSSSGPSWWTSPTQGRAPAAAAAAHARAAASEDLAG